MQQGTYKNRDRLFQMQLKDLLSLYLDHSKDTYRSKTTGYTIGLLCRDQIGNCTLARLDGVKLANFKNRKLETKSPSTVRKYLLLISRAINVGRKELGIPFDSNPVEMVTLPTEPSHRDRVLTNAERQSLYKACDQSDVYNMRLIVEFAFETLCRRGEIFNLEYADCNLSTGEAKVRETKNGKPRRIGLSTRAIAIIRSLPRAVSGKLFAVKSLSSFEKSFKRTVANARIKDFHFHDLRHSGATYLAEKGWSSIELMAQGGWSSADMVKKYANISAKHLAKRLSK
jgi:integrase